MDATKLYQGGALNVPHRGPLWLTWPVLVCRLVVTVLAIRGLLALCGW